MDAMSQAAQSPVTPTITSPVAPPVAPGITSPTTPSSTAAARRAAVLAAFGTTYDGVVLRSHLRQHGITWSQLRAELDAGRWHRWGRTTISLTGEHLSPLAFQWYAVWESGSGAVLDGATALLAHGLTSWSESLHHVSVPKGTRTRRVRGVRCHELRWVGPTTRSGVPATVPSVAAIRAAQWAASDRAAVTVLTMAVQQRLVTAGDLLHRWQQWEHPTRRRLLDEALPLICGGVRALGEFDFARLCRARGLPEPDRQVLVDLAGSPAYLDAYWRRYGVHAELNGAQHYRGLAPVVDALRHNSRALRQDISLQVPVLGLVTDPAPFLDQVERALRSRGWS